MSNNYTLPLRPLALPGAVVRGDTWRFTILTDSLVRMEYQSQGRFTDTATQTVLCRDFPVPEYRVMETEGQLEIVTEKLHLYYDKKPFSAQGLKVQLRTSYHIYGSNWHFGDTINDLKGTARTLDNVDGATELESGLLSRGGFTVLDDSHTALLLEDQSVEPRTDVCQDLYFFGYGHDYIRCLRDFYRLSGPTPLLPRFTLGNWWSRYHPYSAESYLDLMHKFRQQEIPFSVAVLDMDWHITNPPREYGSGWTGYTWNRTLFPEPKAFLDALHKMNLRVTLNVHPADGVRAHEQAYPAMAAALGIDSERKDKIPFEATDKRFMDAYFTYLHHPHEEMGVDFWWLDWQQGSRSGMAGVDTLWMLNHLHFLDSGREGRTPLTFSRYAGIGSHRYPIGFSGDTFATWASLAFQPYFTANAGNVGYSWWSHDIGGHQGGSRDDELAVRWVQFGVFSPIMRLHSTANAFCGKEPWNYNPQAEQTMVRFLQLRHKLIPYLYSMNYRTHLEGEPLLQPMYYRHDEPDAYAVPNQYYFGSQLIVCPITQPADKYTLLSEFDAWLPDGRYIDLFTKQLYCGGRRLKLYRSQESIPVLLPFGGILPLTGDPTANGCENPHRLEIVIANGANGSFDLYEDDGTGRDRQPAITHITFASGDTARITIDVEGKVDGVIPADREYEFCLLAVVEPTAVTLSKGATEISRNYSRGDNTFRLGIQGGGSMHIEIELTMPTRQPANVNKTELLYKMLLKAQLPNNQKAAVFDAVCQEENIGRLFGKLSGMNLNPNLTGAITEILVGES